MKSHRPLKEPNFMIGLRCAKNILLTLRQQKIMKREEEIEGTPISVRDVDESIMEVKKIQKEKEERVSEQVKVCRLLNKIGKQLFQCYEDIEQYEIVFNQLVSYYSSKLPIMDENERLKKQSFELEEQIQHYRDKIDQNYQQAHQEKNKFQKLKQLVQQKIQQFLISERQRANIQMSMKPYLNLSQLLEDAHPLDEKYEEEEEQEQFKVNLNFKNLKQQLIKKPGLKKPKHTVMEQSSMDHFYQSDIYNM